MFIKLLIGKNNNAFGRIWINKDNKILFILSKDFSKYKKIGWSKGRK